MNDEQLILLVQANECLYNKNSPDFKMADKKRRVWKEIAQEMNLPENVCIKRWSCLRDRYAKEKRMESLPSGSSAKAKPRWPLMESMEFISPYIFPRTTRCSFNVLDQTSSSEALPQSPSLTEDCCEYPICSSEATSQSEVERPRKRKHSDVSETNKGFLEAVDSFKKLCEVQTQKKEDDKDPLKRFGQMIAALLATMSFERQAEAMQHIIAYIMELKLKPE